MEENLRRAAQEWRTTFDAITDFVSIHDRDFRVVRVNKAFADLVGMKPQEIIGKHCYEIVHRAKQPVANCPHKLTIETGRSATAEIYEPSLGKYLEVTTSPIFNGKGELVATVHIARDITEHKKMDEQLMLTDRLASIGELASGIAHELNNPLTSVVGFSDLLLEKDVPDDIKEDLGTINREAKRTAQVVRNLLTFARRHELAKQSVGINGIMQRVLEMRAYEHKVNNIQVNTHFAADLPEVLAAGSQLQQVFLNITINAEYFMFEAHQGGTLTVTTERAGDIVKASIADDGPGIAKENLGQIFAPFFTTKGQGTGLGLAVSKRIVEEHGGSIAVSNNVSGGVTFTITLPVHAEDPGLTS